MTDTENKPESRLAKLGELSKKGFDRAKESIVQSSHIVKLRLDVSTLKKEKKRILTDLGEEVYSAMKAGKLRTKLFQEDIANIDDLAAKIEEKEKELEQVSARTTEKEVPAEEETPSAVKKESEEE